MNLVCEILRDILKYTMNFHALKVGCTKSENLGIMSDTVKTLYEDMYTNQRLTISYTLNPDYEMQNIDNGSRYLKRVGDKKLSKCAMYESRNLLSFCRAFKNVF